MDLVTSTVNCIVAYAKLRPAAVWERIESMKVGGLMVTGYELCVGSCVVGVVASVVVVATVGWGIVLYSHDHVDGSWSYGHVIVMVMLLMSLH